MRDFPKSIRVPRRMAMTAAMSFLALTALAACGGGGHTDATDPEPIPAGIPVIAGGFTGWWDVQTTPDSTIGIVNAQGQFVVAVEFTDTAGTTHFDTMIAPGALWASGAGLLPGFYLVSAYGADGRIFKKYFRYDPDTGREATVISNANWYFDF